MYQGEIDWAPLQQYEESTCYCNCGKVFGSHAKGVSTGAGFSVVSQRPCPSCGQNDDLRRVSSPPEKWTVG